MLHWIACDRSMLGSVCMVRHGAMSDLLSQIAKDRSEAAFRKLFADYGPRLRSYMMRQGASRAQAEELAQETLLAVWTKAGLYAPDKGSVSTWIFTIARNLRLDRLRRETVWQELTEEHAATIPDHGAPPDAVIDEQQTKARVHALLDELPPDQFEVVHLAFMEGLTQSEIAERLALPLGTVKSRLRLAYQKLRPALEDLK